MFFRTWFLLLLAETVLCIRVFLHPEPASSLLHTRLTPVQARIVVSHQLGLEAFDSVEDVENAAELLSSKPFLSRGPSNAMLLTISEDVARDVMPHSLHTSYSLQDPLSVSSEISNIVSSYLQRAASIYSTIYSSTTTTPRRTIPRQLDIFSTSPSPSVESFLSEMTEVVSLLESDELNAFGAFELKGMSKIVDEFGRRSEEYQLAAGTTRAMLLSAMEYKEKLSFVILTYPRTSAWLEQRQQRDDGEVNDNENEPLQQSPLPAEASVTIAPQLPISSVSTCYLSTGACSNATSSCSGRGECVEATKAGKTCFVCACKVTVEENGQREYWAGEACERKDVSAPFTLITGTVIGLLVIIVGSVMLLYKVGSQELPAILTASASGPIKLD